MTITRTLIRAALLAGSVLAFSVPAYAQPAGGNDTLGRIMGEAMAANTEAVTAAARCDGSGVDAARAKLAALEEESRRAARDAANATKLGISAIDPAAADAVYKNVKALHAQADSYALTNCPVPRQPVQVGSAATGYPFHSSGSPNGSWVLIHADVASANVARTGIGVEANGTETFAGLTHRNVTKWGGAVRGNFMLPRMGSIRFDGSYMEGKSRGRFDIPITNGVDLGLVYSDFSPGGSTGIIQPFFGLSGTTDVRMRQARADLCWILDVFGDEMSDEEYEAKAKELAMYGGPCVSWNYNRIRYDMTAGFSGNLGGNLFQADQIRDQTIKNNMYGLGGVIGTTMPLGGSFSFNLEAGAQLYRLHSTLDSLELNSNNFSGMLDRDFSIDIRETRNRTGWHPHAEIGLNYSLSPTVGLTLGGRYDYWSKVGSVFNPSSGDDLFIDNRHTELQTHGLSEWTAFAGLRVAFGMPEPPPPPPPPPPPA
jgi:hypothetical protein